MSDVHLCILHFSPAHHELFWSQDLLPLLLLKVNKTSVQCDNLLIMFGFSSQIPFLNVNTHLTVIHSTTRTHHAMINCSPLGVPSVRWAVLTALTEIETLTKFFDCDSSFIHANQNLKCVCFGRDRSSNIYLHQCSQAVDILYLDNGLVPWSIIQVILHQAVSVLAWSQQKAQQSVCDPVGRNS